MKLEKILSIPGRFEIVDDLGKKHFFLVSAFSNHDHKKYPIYYLDYPLSSEDYEAEKDFPVITIVGLHFSEPYSSALYSTWEIVAAQGRVFIELKDKKTVLFSFESAA